MTLDTAKTYAEWMAAFKAEHWRAELQPSEALRRVRTLLSIGGWCEPFSVGTALCLDDALRAVAPSLQAAVLLELELQRQLRVNGVTDSLTSWLKHIDTHLADVQQLLATVERRLALEEKRHV
jgi:hypothetical protein